jgi:hypothetical protein
MNKRYWQMEKITDRECFDVLLTDAQRQEIKWRGQRAQMFLAHTMALLCH